MQVSFWPTEGVFYFVLVCFASPFCVKFKMWSYNSPPFASVFGFVLRSQAGPGEYNRYIRQLNESLHHLLVSSAVQARSVVTGLLPDSVNIVCGKCVTFYDLYLQKDGFRWNILTIWTISSAAYLFFVLNVVFFFCTFKEIVHIMLLWTTLTFTVWTKAVEKSIFCVPLKKVIQNNMRVVLWYFRPVLRPFL